MFIRSPGKSVVFRPAGLKFFRHKSADKGTATGTFSFSKGKDTFAVLPTGHGKSLIYQMAVLLANKMNKDRPLIIVISPLKSSIADQIREFGRFGLSSCKLEAENVEPLKKECNFDIIFASPEVF